MRRLLTCTLFQAALLLPALGQASQDVTLEQLPPAVKATVERETQGGQITEIEREDEQGRVIYEVEFTSGGKEYELDIAEDGKLLERRLD
jgi:uncharacterized membrane protein YkoI